MVVAKMLNCFRFSHFHTVNDAFALIFPNCDIILSIMSCI